MTDEIKSEIEDKYKLTFLQIDKRFVDLELAVGELSEKIKAFDTKAIADLQEKVDSLESLILVENLGVMELKKIMENLEKRFEEVPKTISLSSEFLEKVASSIIPILESSILPKIETRISEIEKKITSFSAQPIATPELEKRLENISVELKNLVAYTQAEIKNLKEKIKPFDEEIIQKIVSEVSDLRTEVSKEIRYIKEKIEGEKATKADIDLKFLSSRVNTLKESVDFLLNRKVEMDQKIQEIENSLAKLEEIAEAVLPEDFVKNFEETKREIASLVTKVSAIESSTKNISEYIAKLEALAKKIERAEEIEKKFEQAEKIKTLSIPEETIRKLIDLENKINLLENKIGEKPYREKPGFFDKEIKDLIDKLVALETRVGALERMLQSIKSKPVVLE